MTLNSLRLYKELGSDRRRIKDRWAGGGLYSWRTSLCEDTFVVHIEKAFAEVRGGISHDQSAVCRA